MPVKTQSPQKKSVAAQGYFTHEQLKEYSNMLFDESERYGAAHVLDVRRTLFFYRNKSSGNTLAHRVAHDWIGHFGVALAKDPVIAKLKNKNNWTVAHEVAYWGHEDEMLELAKHKDLLLLRSQNGTRVYGILMNSSYPKVHEKVEEMLGKNILRK